MYTYFIKIINIFSLKNSSSEHLFSIKTANNNNNNNTASSQDYLVTIKLKSQWTLTFSSSKSKCMPDWSSFPTINITVDTGKNESSVLDQSCI